MPGSEDANDAKLPRSNFNSLVAFVSFVFNFSDILCVLRVSVVKLEFVPQLAAQNLA